MDERLLKTIKDNKIILILTATNISKNLQEHLSKNVAYKTINFAISDATQIENLPQDKNYCFILTGFAEDGQYENIFNRYELDRFDAKIIIICRPALLAHYPDPSLYFVPNINNRLQKKYFAKYQLDTAVNVNTLPRPSKLFLKHEIPVTKDVSKTTSLRDHFLNQKLLTRDAVMMEFLADRVQENEAYKVFLFGLVYASREDSNMQIAAANAITGLNYARVSFSHNQHLQHISIPNAVLDEGIFYFNNFFGSNLEKVSFRESYMGNAILDKCNMRDIIFGERASINLSDIESIEYLEKAVCSLAFSHDGEILAIAAGNMLGGNGSSIHFWNVKNEIIYRTVVVNEGAIKLLTFHPYDNNELISVSKKKLSRWIVNEGSCLEKFDTPHKIAKIRFNTENSISLIPPVKSSSHTSYSSDGNYFAFAQSNLVYSISIVSMITKNVVGELKGHLSEITCTSFSPTDSNILASCSTDTTVRLWNIELKINFRIFMHKAMVLSLAFSPTGTLLISGDVSGLVRFWDLGSEDHPTTKRELAAIKSFFIVGNRIYTLSDRQKKIEMLHIKTGKKLGNIDCSDLLNKGSMNNFITSMSAAVNLQLLAISSTCNYKESVVCLRNIVTNTIIWKFILPYNVKSIDVSPDGKILALGWWEEFSTSMPKFAFSAFIHSDPQGGVSLWDVASCSLMRTFNSQAVDQLKFSNDGKFLFAITVFSNGRLLDSMTGENLFTLDNVNCALFCGTDKLLAIATKQGNGYVFIYNLMHRTISYDIKNENAETIEAIGFSEKNNFFVFGDSNGYIHFWCIDKSCNNYKFFQKIKAHTEKISQLRFSEDENTLFSSSIDGSIACWSIDDLHCVKLCWQSNPQFIAEKMSVDDVKNLSTNHARFLKQQGATVITNLELALKKFGIWAAKKASVLPGVKLPDGNNEEDDQEFAQAIALSLQSNEFFHPNQ